MTQPINFFEAVIQIAKTKNVSAQEAAAFLKQKMAEDVLPLTLTQVEFDERLAGLEVA